jgi:hypothetical protein
MPGDPGRPDRLTISLHYGRAGRTASGRGLCVSAAICAIACVLLAPFASAQYPGQIKTDKDKDKEAPSLRAIGVLEWTGDLSKPKTSRLVPIAVFDGEQLQDASVYLARPQPLAVSGGVEYILQKNGAKLGLFDVMSAGQQLGSWVGFGTWKPMPKPKPPAPVMAKVDEDDARSDRPTLHRKHDSGGDSKSGDASSGDRGAAPDPDRPTLHKKSSDDSKSDDSKTGASGQGQSGQGDSGQTSSSAPSDPDRPTLHKTPDAGQTTGQPSSSTSGTDTAKSSDPDRPTLKHGKAKQEPDEGYVSSVQNTDPDRPRLARGKSTVSGPDITPTLVGLPSGMEQAVAVSDPRNHPDHPWNYTWADPTDESKMKAALEDAARQALGLQATPPAVAAKPANTTSKGRAIASKTRAKAAPPEPAPLADEEFRVFELAYGSGATLVLTAHTDGPPEHQKFVTLIAQPDLYGSLLVLFKSVTDAAHLDDTPRMRLVDAVDALADNRGELLFELRGTAQRQFALYRVVRGTAKELFVTGGGATSIEAQN